MGAGGALTDGSALVVSGVVGTSFLVSDGVAPPAGGSLPPVGGVPVSVGPGAIVDDGDGADVEPDVDVDVDFDVDSDWLVDGVSLSEPLHAAMNMQAAAAQGAAISVLMRIERGAVTKGGLSVSIGKPSGLFP